MYFHYYFIKTIFGFKPWHTLEETGNNSNGSWQFSKFNSVLYILNICTLLPVSDIWAGHFFHGIALIINARETNILYFPWSRLSYWLCVLTNVGNITLVFCPVLHPGTCGHRRRPKIWKSPHRTNFSQSDEKSHKFAREKWEEGRLSHWRAR